MELNGRFARKAAVRLWAIRAAAERVRARVGEIVTVAAGPLHVECRVRKFLRKNSGAPVWIPVADFRYLLRCFPEHPCVTALIRFNYLQQTQRFYVGATVIHIGHAPDKPLDMVA